MEDVARRANVSRSTVSLVIRNSPLVAKETADRVKRSVLDLKYVPNRQAASLRSKRSNLFGMVVPNILNSVYAAMMSGVEQEFTNSETLFAWCNSQDNLERQVNALRNLSSHGVDGVILVPAPGTLALPLITNLEPLAGRCVLLGRDVPDAGLDFVGTDNFIGGKMAAAHLFQQGYRRVAFVGGPIDSSARRERLAGYCAACQAHGNAFDDRLVVETGVTVGQAYHATMSFLQCHTDVRGIVCFNSVVGFGVFAAITRVGHVVGQDFGIVTFDHVEQAELWKPPLTTIGVEPIELGAQAARALKNRLQSPRSARQRVVLLPDLRVRESSQRLSGSTTH